MLHSLVEQTRLTGVIAGARPRARPWWSNASTLPSSFASMSLMGARAGALHIAWKILIANLPKEQLASLIAAHGTAGRTPNTIVSRARLIRSSEIVAPPAASAPCPRKSTSSESARDRVRRLWTRPGAVIAAVSAAELITRPVWSRPRAAS